MKLTADTITDAQILRLREELLAANPSLDDRDDVCTGRTHRDHATITCNGTCCTACGGPVDNNQACRC